MTKTTGNRRRRFGRFIARVFVGGISLLGAAPALQAAPPKLNYFYPAGAQRGQTVVVTAGGEFSTWPVSLWADRPGVTAQAEADKGKFKITLPADAAPGVVWLRAFNEEGASPLRPLVIGSLPEVEEAEPNDAPDKPPQVSLPAVANGRLAKDGDVDSFAFDLQQGQTLAAVLQANQLLNSPVDALLQVCELVERRGETEAFVVAQNHDGSGLDPQLRFVAPRTGKYLVRVFGFPSEPNASIAFAGGENYLYRLTLTTAGLVDQALPLTVSSKQPSSVKLFGSNLPAEGLPLDITPPESLLPGESFAVAHTDHAGTAPVLLTAWPSLVASDTSSLAQPHAIELPIVVSGRLGSQRAAHVFALTATQGAKVRIACESRSLGYALQASIRVIDDTGKALINGPVKGPRLDPEAIFTAPADGRYRITIADQHGRGGPRFVYRLSLHAPQPEFGLNVAADSFVLAADKPLEIPITIDRRDGFAQPIEIKAVDLPAGVVAEAVTSQPTGDTAKTVTLVLKRGENGAPASQPIRIVGTSAGEPPREQPVRFTLGGALAGSHGAIWLTVAK